jgi:hypothetical protein
MHRSWVGKRPHDLHIHHYFMDDLSMYASISSRYLVPTSWSTNVWRFFGHVFYARWVLGKRERRVDTRCSTSGKHARACAVMCCVYSIPVRNLCPTCAPTRYRTAFPVFHNPSPLIALQVGAMSEPARLTPPLVPTSHHWLGSTSDPARPTPPLVPISYHWLSATSEPARPTLAGGRAIQWSCGPLLNAPRLSSTAAVVVRSRWPSVFAYGSHKFFGKETRKRRERESALQSLWFGFGYFAQTVREPRNLFWPRFWWCAQSKQFGWRLLLQWRFLREGRLLVLLRLQ